MKVILLFLLLVPAYCFSQTDTAIYYQKVIHLGSMAKDSIYTKAMVWAADAWVDSRYAIEFKDKDAGVIKGNFSLSTFLPSFNRKNDLPVTFEGELRIEAKDNRIRISMTNIKESDLPLVDKEKPPYDIFFMSSKKVKLRWEEIKRQLPSEGERLAKSLKEYLSTTENW